MAQHVQIVGKDHTWEGDVISAHNFGTDDDPDWYIEFVAGDGSPHYLKQKQDHHLTGDIEIHITDKRKEV
jgi:hypothetical protein